MVESSIGIKIKKPPSTWMVDGGFCFFLDQVMPLSTIQPVAVDDDKDK